MEPSTLLTSAPLLAHSGKLLQVDIIWWATVYDIKNCELRTSLQSVVAMRFDSLRVELALP